MANNLKNMYQIKQIYQLLHLGNSQRKVSELMSISRSTVKSYIALLAKASIKLDAILLLDDEQLMGLVRSIKDKATPLQETRHKQLAVHFSYMEKELKRTGVTLEILWQEYKFKQPDGYSYVQFCYHYRNYAKRMKTSMHFDHVIGDMLMIDYAGDKLSYVDVSTGDAITCQVLVTVLPYSGLIYATAMHTQSQIDFIHGMNNCLKFIGGVPKNILSDNLKTVVTKADRYEPNFSDLALQFSTHYQTNLMATRVAKPTDKGMVENAVKHVYRKIYAPLRNKTYYSLTELNEAIMEQIVILNAKAFQGRTYSRADLFIEEKKQLQALPNSVFEAYKIKKATVQRNYHIQIDKQYYSVPHVYVGKELTVHYNATTIEVYTATHQRIAIHSKAYQQLGYNTIKEHMPANHSGYLESRGWNADYFRKKASEVGPYTLLYIEKIFTTKNYIEQTYLSCKGVFRLVGIYNTLRVERACQRLENIERASYKKLEEVLKKNLDQDIQTPCPLPPSIHHENIRGKYY